jgi:YjbE family integral membrane protein
VSGIAEHFNPALLNPALWRVWFSAAIAQFGYAAFWIAVLRIIFVNILLSGDNAVVIAMACRGLPPPQRRWGLIAGAGIAVLLRIVLVGVLAFLMLLPYFKLLGGLALVLIAARLLVPETSGRDDIQAAAQLWRAVTIIAIADVVMSFDNMVAIAAIAQGNVLLLALGLAVSIPLVVVGAAMVMALLSRFPVLVWAGAALLGWIAGELIVADAAVSSRLVVAFGAKLVQQIGFAAPATGAALAIAAGGLWRCWHEDRRLREQTSNA